MDQGMQQPNFERNPCIRYSDKCDTDGRRAGDGKISIADIALLT